MHNGHPRYSATNPKIFARNRRLVGFSDGTTSSAYVDDFSGEVEAWCPECGLEARWVAAKVLMAAVRGDRSKVVLVRNNARRSHIASARCTSLNHARPVWPTEAARAGGLTERSSVGRVRFPHRRAAIASRLVGRPRDARSARFA